MTKREYQKVIQKLKTDLSIAHTAVHALGAENRELKESLRLFGRALAPHLVEYLPDRDPS